MKARSGTWIGLIWGILLHSSEFTHQNLKQLSRMVGIMHMVMTDFPTDQGHSQENVGSTTTYEMYWILDCLLCDTFRFLRSKWAFSGVKHITEAVSLLVSFTES